MNLKQQKKTIGILHYTAPPVVGGVESVIAHHARLLAAADYPVRLLAGRGGAQDAPVEFVYLPLADSLHPLVLAAKAALDEGTVPEDFEELVEQVTAELATAVTHTHILIAHNVCSLHKNLALTAALHRVCAQPGAPRLILWHHDLAWTTPRYQAELHPGWPWDLLHQPWSDVAATHVVVSELRRRELADLLALPPETIQVIPSGLDSDEFLRLAEDTAVLLDQIPWRQASPRLLLPVRITRRKNIELALHTVAALRQTMPQAGLLVTGPPGPHNPTNQLYFDELRQLRADLGLENQVHFLAEITAAYVPDDVIADLYRLADALFFPSREEGFGIPMLEAGLLGLPIFCADIAPLREIAGPYATYFSPDSDPEALAIQITDHLTRSASYQLRQRVRRSYTWRGIFAEKIAPLLEEHDV
ncbi:MAG TPA: glycosyltransferase [Chloroflexota bacterium]|nr:glycosyltransferase [Chloroflexota bacterium]